MSAITPPITPASASTDVTSDGVASDKIGRIRVESAPWGNAAPLALAAFAITTFMLSMVNANWIDKRVEPVVFGVALMFGGLTQLIAGIIQFRNGSTFTGMLFGAFGAFWLSLFAIVQFFLKSVPAAQTGHALGCSCTRSGCSLSSCG